MVTRTRPIMQRSTRPMRFVFGPLCTALGFALALGSAATQGVAQASPLTPHQQSARAIYQEMVEINTVDSVGSVTRAAEAVAARFVLRTSCSRCAAPHSQGCSNQG